MPFVLPVNSAMSSCLPGLPLVKNRMELLCQEYYCPSLDTTRRGGFCAGIGFCATIVLWECVPGKHGARRTKDGRSITADTFNYPGSGCVFAFRSAAAAGTGQGPRRGTEGIQGWAQGRDRSPGCPAGGSAERAPRSATRVGTGQRPEAGWDRRKTVAGSMNRVQRS